MGITFLEVLAVNRVGREVMVSFNDNCCVAVGQNHTLLFCLWYNAPPVEETEMNIRMNIIYIIKLKKYFKEKGGGCNFVSVNHWVVALPNNHWVVALPNNRRLVTYDDNYEF